MGRLRERIPSLEDLDELLQRVMSADLLTDHRLRDGDGLRAIRHASTTLACLPWSSQETRAPSRCGNCSTATCPCCTNSCHSIRRAASGLAAQPALGHLTQVFICIIGNITDITISITNKPITTISKGSRMVAMAKALRCTSVLS